MGPTDYIIVVGGVTVLVGIFLKGWLGMVCRAIAISIVINEFVRSILEEYLTNHGDYTTGFSVFPFVSNWANLAFWAIVAFSIMFWLHRRKLKTTPR